jgi:hypothetical protein
LPADDRSLESDDDPLQGVVTTPSPCSSGCSKPKPTLDVGWEKITALNIASGFLTAAAASCS